MKIGFAQIFPYRPHPTHEAYLRHLVELNGDVAASVMCGGSRLPCYNKALKGNGILECAKCRIGGSVGYWPTSRISVLNLDTASSRGYPIDTRYLIESAGFLRRVETLEEERSEGFQQFYERFRPMMQATYHATVKWIEKQRLEGLVLFNGRQDITAAIRIAAEHCNLPFVTHERTWFGPGISLNPGVNCNSLKNVVPMVEEYDSSPLTDRQSRLAFNLIAARFSQNNLLEWRLYNPNPESTGWPSTGPGQSGKKVLIVPSSRCEFVGSDEYKLPWGDNLNGLTLLVEILQKERCSIILRGHPVWAERIGPRDGRTIERSYREWAQANGVTFIGSDSKKSTYDLIGQADTVVLNGGSSAVEAGFLGKQVICIGPSTYMRARFVTSLLTTDDFSSFRLDETLPKEDVCASTLRFVYTRYGRFPQFVKYVRPEVTTSYKFYDGADPGRLIRMLTQQRVVADDPSFDSEGQVEQQYVELALAGQFSGVDERSEDRPDAKELNICSRWPYRAVHLLRSRLQKGDKR